MYYHVQNAFHNKVELFEPRVPYNRAKLENDYIKRVCVAPTIKQAIIASPFLLEDVLTDGIFCGDLNGLPIRIYEFLEVPFLPNKLDVCDVEETGEGWFLTDIKYDNLYYGIFNLINNNNNNIELKILSEVELNLTWKTYNEAYPYESNKYKEVKFSNDEFKIVS